MLSFGNNKILYMQKFYSDDQNTPKASISVMLVKTSPTKKN